MSNLPLNLRGKLFLFLISPILLIILGSGIITYLNSTEALAKANEGQYMTTRKALKELATTSYEMTQQMVTNNLKTADAILQPKIQLGVKQVIVNATHQVSKESHSVAIPDLLLDGTPAYGNTNWVDSLSKLVNGASTVFQMMPGGMLRVSTSVRKQDGARAIGTYIPDDSPVYKAIASGKPYLGRALVAGDWYVAGYSPVSRSGKVIGAVFVGIPQGNLDVLRNRIISFKVGEHGFAQIIDTSGKQIIHPDASLEGTIRKSKHHETMIQNKDGVVLGKQQSNLNGKKGSTVVYAYTLIPEMQWIVTACAYQEELEAPVIQIRNLLLLTIIVGFIIALLLGIWMTNTITNPLIECVAIANSIAKGNTQVEIRVNTSDENGRLKQAMLSMVESLQRMRKDAHMLSQAATSGKLNVRANLQQHEGEFREIIQGVNQTLDTFTTPIHVTAQAIDSISRGEIPPEITEVYQGDFNTLRLNLNQCIRSIHALIEDSSHLAKGALDGKLSMRADLEKHQGDFKRIVQGMNGTLDAISLPLQEASSVLDHLAKRNLTVRMQGNYLGDFNQIKASLNQAVANLDEALSQVAESAKQVESASQQISSGSQSLAEGASEQASSLDKITTSLKEMAVITKQNSQSALAAKQLANSANSDAKTGQAAMSRMSEAIQRIKTSSDETAQIIKTIDEIAMQTNLLALNAAVEAARAGDAGRGFAVVAEEVRNLAQRSAQAAKNTADRIGESVNNATNGVQIALDASESFQAIALGVQHVNDLITEITASSAGQSEGISRVTLSTDQMDKVTQQNAAHSEESASAAEELSSQAKELLTMVSGFQLSGQASQNPVR